ncbi:MAG: hypothetical protein J6W59_05285, partial [Bacteroidales bacterium]|nr:hypothetical protein [Bacteroidales bacterium]
ADTVPAPECTASLIELLGNECASAVIATYPDFYNKTGQILNSPDVLYEFLFSEETHDVISQFMPSSFFESTLKEELLTQASLNELFIQKGQQILSAVVNGHIGTLQPGDARYPTGLLNAPARSYKIDRAYQPHMRILQKDQTRNGRVTNEPVVYKGNMPESVSGSAEMVFSYNDKTKEASYGEGYKLELALASLIESAGTYGNDIAICDISSEIGREVILRSLNEKTDEEGDVVRVADQDVPMIVLEKTPYKGENAEEIYNRLKLKGALIVNPNELSNEAKAAINRIRDDQGFVNVDARPVAEFISKSFAESETETTVDKYMENLGVTAGKDLTRHVVVSKKEARPAMLSYIGNTELINNRDSMGTVAVIGEMRMPRTNNGNPAGTSAARNVAEAIAAQPERVTLAASLNCESGRAAIEAAMQRGIPVIAVTAYPLSGEADKGLIERIVATGGLVLSEADTLNKQDRDILIGRSLDLLTSISSSVVVVEALRKDSKMLSANRRMYMEPEEVLSGYKGRIAVVSYGEQRAADICKAFLSVEDGETVDYDGLVAALKFNKVFTEDMQNAIQDGSFTRMAKRMADRHGYADSELYAGASKMLSMKGVHTVSLAGTGLEDMLTFMKNDAPEQYIGRRYLLDRSKELDNGSPDQLDPDHLRF